MNIFIINLNYNYLKLLMAKLFIVLLFLTSIICGNNNKTKEVNTDKTNHDY